MKVQAKKEVWAEDAPGGERGVGGWGRERGVGACIQASAVTPGQAGDTEGRGGALQTIFSATRSPGCYNCSRHEYFDHSKGSCVPCGKPHRPPKAPSQVPHPPRAPQTPHILLVTTQLRLPETLASLSPVSTNRKSISLPSSSPNINPPGPPDPTLPPCWGVWAWTGNPLGTQHQVAQTTALSWDGTEEGADGGRRKAGTWAPLWQLRPLGSVAARGGGQTLFTAPFLAVPPPATPGPTTGDCTRPRCRGEGRSPPAPRQLGGAVSVGSGQVVDNPVPASAASVWGMGRGARQDSPWGCSAQGDR